MWRAPPPIDESELLARAHALHGVTITELAERMGSRAIEAGVRTKGKVGTLVERALGATGGSGASWDFPALRVELKTIPLRSDGTPAESTFVCTLRLLDADRTEWAESWARAKLARVLWVPIRASGDGERRIEAPVLWSPTSAQERILRDDFEEIVGRIGAGDIEGVTGHVGRWLQLRPKAAHGRVRTGAPGAEGGRIATVPRGFYLRGLFTSAILHDPAATPDA